MKSLENIISMIIVVCILLLMPVALAEAHYARCLTVTGESSVEELASQIGREKVLTVLNYNQHADELYRCGFEGELRVSFYVYETVAGSSAAEPERRKYVTTWEEIREQLLSEPSYRFPDNAYVCVTAEAYAGKPSPLRRFIHARTDYSAFAYIERGGVQ